MANTLKKCDSCGAEIALSAKSCPQCGAKNKKPFYKKWWFWVIVVVVIGAIGSSIGDGDGSKPSSLQPVTSVTKESKPELIVVDVDTLLDTLEGNALNAKNTYKGKYVEVTGRLSVIDSDGKYFTLDPLSGSFTLVGVRCSIAKEHQNIIANFSKKQEVTVIGTITDVGEIMGYSLRVDSIK